MNQNQVFPFASPSPYSYSFCRNDDFNSRIQINEFTNPQSPIHQSLIHQSRINKHFPVAGLENLSNLNNSNINYVMSRGFVKEEDQEEAPFIPPRAALPPGVINYVTPTGLQQLLEEKKDLENERTNIKTGNDTERRRTLAVIDGKLNLLKERISAARVLEPSEQPAGEVRFGAQVSLKYLKKNLVQEFQIVGIDEADVKKQKIAFVAPIARAITGKRLGEVADFKLGNELRKLEILEINYNF